MKRLIGKEVAVIIVVIKVLLKELPFVIVIHYAGSPKVKDYLI